MKINFECDSNTNSHSCEFTRDVLETVFQDSPQKHTEIARLLFQGQGRVHKYIIEFINMIFTIVFKKFFNFN